MTQYWRHALSRIKLRGAVVTWSFLWPRGWVRVGRLIIRWEMQ